MKFKNVGCEGRKRAYFLKNWFQNRGLKVAEPFSVDPEDAWKAQWYVPVMPIGREQVEQFDKYVEYLIENNMLEEMK